MNYFKKPKLSCVGYSNRVLKTSLFIHNWCTLLLIEHPDAQLWFIVFQSQLKMAFAVMHKSKEPGFESCKVLCPLCTLRVSVNEGMSMYKALNLGQFGARWACIFEDKFIFMVVNFSSLLQRQLISLRRRPEKIWFTNQVSADQWSNLKSSS